MTNDQRGRVMSRQSENARKRKPIPAVTPDTSKNYVTAKQVLGRSENLVDRELGGIESWLKQTGHDNFVERVLSVMNLPIKVDLATVPNMNPSISPRALEVQILANEKLTEPEAHGLADWFERNVPKSPDDKHGLLSKTEKNKLIKRFQSSNKRLFEEYITDYDPAFYLEPDK